MFIGISVSLEGSIFLIRYVSDGDEAWGHLSMPPRWALFDTSREEEKTGRQDS